MRSPKNPAISSKHHWFLQTEVTRIYLSDTVTLYCAVWPGAGIAHSQGTPPNFYPPHMYVRPRVLPLPPLCTSLPISTHLHISAPPTHQDECGFFKSLVVGLPYSWIFWWFWVLFVLRFSSNSFCGCMRGWSVSTYSSILIRRVFLSTS